MFNPFFKNYGPISISDIIKYLNIKTNKLKFDQEITDVKDLYTASNTDITFFHTKKYKDLANNTKATLCITTKNLKNELPKRINITTIQEIFLRPDQNRQYKTSRTNYQLNNW